MDYLDLYNDKTILDLMLHEWADYNFMEIHFLTGVPINHLVSLIRNNVDSKARKTNNDTFR